MSSQLLITKSVEILTYQWLCSEEASRYKVWMAWIDLGFPSISVPLPPPCTTPTNPTRPMGQIFWETSVTEVAKQIKKPACLLNDRGRTKYLPTLLYRCIYNLSQAYIETDIWDHDLLPGRLILKFIALTGGWDSPSLSLPTACTASPSTTEANQQEGSFQLGFSKPFNQGMWYL